MANTLETFDNPAEVAQRVAQLQKDPKHRLLVTMDDQNFLCFSGGKTPQWHVKSCLNRQQQTAKQKKDVADRLRIKLLKKKVQAQLTA